MSNLSINQWWNEVAKEGDEAQYGNRGDFGGADWVEWLKYARDRPGGTQQGYTDFMDWYRTGAGRDAIWEGNREGTGGLYDHIANVRTNPSAYFGNRRADPDAHNKIQGDDRMTFYASGGAPWDFYNFLNQNQGQLQGGDVRGAEGGLYETTRARAWDDYQSHDRASPYNRPDVYRSDATEYARGYGPQGYMRKWWGPTTGRDRRPARSRSAWYNIAERAKEKFGDDYEWDHIGNLNEEGRDTKDDSWKEVYERCEWGAGGRALDIHGHSLIPQITYSRARTAGPERHGSKGREYYANDPWARFGSIDYEYYNTNPTTGWQDKLDQWKFESGLSRDTQITTKAQIDDFTDFYSGNRWSPPEWSQGGRPDATTQTGATHLNVDGNVVGAVGQDGIDWTSIIDDIRTISEGSGGGGGDVNVEVQAPQQQPPGTSLAGSSALYGTSATGVAPRRSTRYQTGQAQTGTQQLNRQNLTIDELNP